MRGKDWFASWFDTPYYHLLYRDRNFDEAQQLVLHLKNKLKMQPNAKVLDLACGKGRHSLTLHQLGMDVLGVDLSAESIAEAKQLAVPGLQFEVHDMRELIKEKKFDYIFNLFTSFGYFDNEKENQLVFHKVNSMLDSKGLFVFDFLNRKSTVKALVPREEKSIDGVDFQIKRHYDGKYIRKNIEVNDNKHVYSFEERVRAYGYEELKTMLDLANFEIQNTYGDFNLNPFYEDESNRIIFICKKKSL